MDAIPEQRLGVCRNAEGVGGGHGGGEKTRMELDLGIGVDESQKRS